MEFGSVPVGVHIFVTTRDMPLSPGNPPKAVLAHLEHGLLGQAISDYETSKTRVGGFPVAEVALHDGAGAAVWEWVSKESVSFPTLDELHFGVAVSAMPGECGRHPCAEYCSVCF